MVNLRLLYAVPDLLFISVIFYSLFKGKKRGAYFGMMAGFIKDIGSGSVFGINLFGFALCGYFLGNQYKRLYIENRITHFAITFLCTLFVSCINFLFTKLSFSETAFFRYMFVFTLPYCVYTSLAAVLLSKSYLKLFKCNHN
jgi:rod shape-determining protein MreD